MSRVIKILERNGLIVHLVDGWHTTARWRSAVQDVGRELVELGNPGTNWRVVSAVALARMFPSVSSDDLYDMARIIAIVEFSRHGKWVHLPLDDQGPTRMFKPRGAGRPL